MKEILVVILVIVLAKIGVDAWQKIPAVIVEQEQERREAEFERSEEEWREKFPEAAKQIE